MDDLSPGSQNEGWLYLRLRRFVDLRPGEVKALAGSWLYFFSILSAYYVIRPIRDEIGAAGGVERLPWLFAGTLIAMTVANPLFSALVSRMAPRRFIAVSYRFFAMNLLLFLVLLERTTGATNVWAGRIFYVWAAVFNLFVVSVFWGFMVDIFSGEQSRRLFGFIAAGGTVGGIAGSMMTAVLVEHTGRAVLLLLSAALLEVGVFCVRRLANQPSSRPERLEERRHEDLIGGTALSGIWRAVRSTYLMNISVYMLLFTTLSTFLYFQQADIARHSFADRAARTAFFADVDLAVNILTLATQIFLTSRILTGLGVATALLLLPALSAAGFLATGLAPTLWAIVAFQVLRRTGNFAVARPSREILFTKLPREDRFKAKSLIDTFVYRAGDQVGAWSYAALTSAGLSLAGIGFVGVPISLAWLLNAWWLGRRHDRLR